MKKRMLFKGLWWSRRNKYFYDQYDTAWAQLMGLIVLVCVPSAVWAVGGLSGFFLGVFGSIGSFFLVTLIVHWLVAEDGQLFNEVYDDGMLDITIAKHVGVTIARGITEAQGWVLHVNTEHGCRLRICRIQTEPILDFNKPPLPEVEFHQAPVWYSAEEAHAWASGYNQALMEIKR